MLLLFSLALVCVTTSESARILAVFPFPSISHQVVFRPLTQELAKRGHELTIITPDPAFPNRDTPTNLTEIDIHDISYDVWRDEVKHASINTFDNVVDLTKRFFKVANEISRVQFKSKEIQTLLNQSREFDLVLTEDCMRPTLIYGHIYKAPVIQLSSLGLLPYNNYQFGIPTHPFLYPNVMSQKHVNMTIRDKLQEYYNFARFKLFYFGDYDDMENELLRSIFGPDVPSISEMTSKVDLLMINSHSLWENNVPVPPNVVRIWGIHKKPEKPLPEDIKSYLDSSAHGVIYMSFGTNTVPSSLNQRSIQAFVKVFSHLPYDVLWKWDKDELAGKTENIRIGKWFPQADLLRHPKVKLFITQGGLQSTEEAINAAVPLIGVPILGDQWYNVEKYQDFRIGVKLDINSLTEDDVRKAIDTVLGDDSYHKNMMSLRRIMRDEPDSALERAVWWTEYVIRHNGAKHLKAAGANLTWSEYYEVTLVSFVVSCVSVLFLAAILILRRVLDVVRTFVRTQAKVKDD